MTDSAAGGLGGTAWPVFGDASLLRRSSAIGMLGGGAMASGWRAITDVSHGVPFSKWPRNRYEGTRWRRARPSSNTWAWTRPSSTPVIVTTCGVGGRQGG